MNLHYVNRMDTRWLNEMGLLAEVFEERKRGRPGITEFLVSEVCFGGELGVASVFRN